jgi:hypothetical protein
VHEREAVGGHGLAVPDAPGRQTPQVSAVGEMGMSLSASRPARAE